MKKRRLLMTCWAIVAWGSFLLGVTSLPNHLILIEKAEAQTLEAPRKIVINEAVRTLLYLPLYHAVEQGYFRDEGLEVEIVTGGTATNSFAAMVSGEANFSQADPMYVPISREKGAKTKVVAQVVGRIAVWGVTMDPSIRDMSASSLRGKKISTQPRPMTAYTYTVKALRDAGLDPGKDVEIIQSKPGTEIVPLLTGRANFAVTLEPNTSIAVKNRARVVLSFPKVLGDQIFTGLMATEDYINKNRATVVDVVRAYQRALTDIHTNTDSAIKSGAKYFPQLNVEVVKEAVQRMINEEVIPTSVLVSEDSWSKAMKVRLKAGDLKSFTAREENVSLDVINAALEPEQR